MPTRSNKKPKAPPAPLPVRFIALCTSCVKGEHACGGDCECRDALCLQHRARLQIPLPENP
jgi:hypothetical protein